MSPDATWDEKIDFFLTGYQAAAEEAARIAPDFTVLFGLELRLDIHDDTDFLIYGADDAFLRAHPDILQMSFDQMADCVHEAGLLLVQAHPFRKKMLVMDWNLLDGIEVFNGNPNHESNNPIADAWAERHHLLKTSGSDYHEEWAKTKPRLSGLYHPGGRGENGSLPLFVQSRMGISCQDLRLSCKELLI